MGSRKASLTAADPGLAPWYLSIPATICIRRLWLVVLISPKSPPAAVFTTCNPLEGVGFLSGLFHLMYSALLEFRFSAWFYFPDKIPWDKWEKCLIVCLDVYFRLPWASSLNSFYLYAGEHRSLLFVLPVNAESCWWAMADLWDVYYSGGSCLLED